MLIDRQITWPLCYKLTLWIITTYLSIWPGSIPKADYTVAFEVSWASYLLFAHFLHNRATAVNVESQGAKLTLSHSEYALNGTSHLVVNDVSSINEITPPHEDTPLLFKQGRYKRRERERMHVFFYKIMIKDKHEAVLNASLLTLQSH